MNQTQTIQELRDAHRRVRLSLLNELAQDVEAFLHADRCEHNDAHFRGSFQMLLNELELTAAQHRAAVARVRDAAMRANDAGAEYRDMLTNVRDRVQK